MADDIVQTIKVEVEGAEEATAALEKIGEGASTSFDETAKAAETAGVSIEDFGKMSEKSQAAYIELSQRVVEGSRSIVASTGEIQQAAASGVQGTQALGGGLDDVSNKSGISSREMKALGKIMGALGAGEVAHLAVSFQRVTSSLGVLGAAALAFAVAAGAMLKWAKDAADAAKGMEDLAKATGASIESLKLQEGAFQSAGIAAKEFKSSLQGLLVGVVGEAPKIQDEIDKTAETAIRAKAALDKLKADQGFQTTQFQIQTQQLAAQTQQLQLQGQQLALNLASVRQQLSTLSATQDIERRRANLTVQDAAANLALLELQDKYLRGKISEASYEKQKAALEQGARDSAIQKARIDLENAQQERDALGQKQAAQRSALQLQEQQIELAQQQLPIQQQQLELARQQLELAKQQFDILKGPDLAAAQRKLAEALANSLGPLIEQFERMRQGSKEAIDPLTTLASQVLALKGALAAAGISSEDMAKGFNASNVEVNKFLPVIAKIVDSLTDLQKLQFGEVLKGTGLPPELIAVLMKGTEELDKFIAKAQELAPARQQLEDFGKGLDSLGKSLSDFGTLVAGQSIATLRGYWDELKSIGAAAKEASLALGSMVTTAPANAWQWLTSSFDAALAQMKARWAEFQQDLARSGTLSPPLPSGAHAAGGLLGGRGSGTSDSNIAWVSRGEHIMPARAVSQPGVLALLEALRLSGGNLRAVLNSMGHFALGGMVAPTLSIPALAGGGMHNVTIAFPGLPEITGLRASSGVVDQLRNAAAMAQVRSGGRKPSRYS
jgi:hypothetical protein